MALYHVFSLFITFEKNNQMQNLILNAAQIQKKITRIAYEIFEEHAGEKEIVLAGVAPGGYLLAKKVDAALKKISPLKTILIKVEIDKKKPVHSATIEMDKKLNLTDKTVILVDDVLNTGKILAYSMNAFLQYPIKCLRLAVLVDRNHNVFPVKSDYTGLSIATTMQDHIMVDLAESGKESVLLKD
jgi:pyrimidine operon attenuation protein / uracil phosphoribosyltransferase